MASFHPSIADLPEVFPVFPLPGAMLLPRGQLPLRIFEPRYVAMIEDSLGRGRMFGMIQPDATIPETANGPGLFRVGCLGRLSAFTETDEGHYLITLTGVIRFTATDEVEMRRGYRRVRGDFARFVADLDLVDRPVGVARDKLIAALRSYFTHRGVEANWDAIKRLSDTMLVTTMAMVCPFDPAEKQALLEAPTDEERAGTLLTLLQMGAFAQSAPSGRG
jgi:Lon protease-like protein